LIPIDTYRINIATCPTWTINQEADGVWSVDYSLYGWDWGIGRMGGERRKSANDRNLDDVAKNGWANMRSG